MTATLVDSWRDLAACRGQALEVFFPPPGPNARRAKEFCQVCPVRAECLDDALSTERGAHQRRHGIRGGLNPEQREQLARRRHAT